MQMTVPSTSLCYFFICSFLGLSFVRSFIHSLCLSNFLYRFSVVGLTWVRLLGAACDFLSESTFSADTLNGVPRVQELCQSRGGRPGLSVLMSLTVSVDVKQH